jgi:hypothetical protein
VHERFFVQITKIQKRQKDKKDALYGTHPTADSVYKN